MDSPAVHQHLISSTEPTRTFDLTCNSTAVTVKSGSSRLNPISPPPFSDPLTLPIITSTPVNAHRKSDCGWSSRSAGNEQPGRQTEQDSDPSVNPLRRMSCALEQEGNNNFTDKTSQSQEKIQTSETHEEKSPSEPFRSESQRDQRVQLPQLDHQQSVGRHGERSICRPASRKTNVLSDPPNRDQIQRSDPDQIQEDLSAREAETSENKPSVKGTKTRPAGRRLKTAAGADGESDLHAKFSAFLFKPKRMRLSDVSASPDPQSPLEDSARKNHPGQEVSAVQVGDVEGDGSEACSGSASDRLQKVFTFNKELLESPAGEKKTSAGDSLSPSTNPAASTCRPDLVRPTVCASTIAKLSRFSFSSTAGPPPAAELTAGPEGETGENADRFSANSTSSPKRRSSGGAAEHQELRTKRAERPVGNTVNLRKRKCFHLGPPDGSKHLSGRPLFASTDLFQDVLDTDWDQEVPKTDKV